MAINFGRFDLTTLRLYVSAVHGMAPTAAGCVPAGRSVHSAARVAHSATALSGPAARRAWGATPRRG